MIKAFIPALVVASALIAPTFAFAQDNGPVSRAQVRAELVQLEKAGYNPSADDVNYPANLQAAQHRIEAQQGAAATAYGPSSAGTAAAGARVSPARANDPSSVYFGQ